MLYPVTLDDDRIQLHVESLCGYIRLLADNISASTNPAITLRDTLDKLIAVNNELQRLDIIIDKAEAITSVRPISLKYKSKVDSLLEEALNKISENSLKSTIKKDIKFNGLAQRVMDKLNEH